MRFQKKDMRRHILLVDDETTILIAFKKLLQSPEVGVDTAETLEDVLEWFERDNGSCESS